MERERTFTGDTNNETIPGKIITLDELTVKLTEGPIFIGEKHTKTFAREVIMELINRGVVNKLFLELANNSDLPEDTKGKESAIKTAAYLNDVNRDRIEQQELEESIIFTENMWNKMNYKNPISMGDLIKCALEKGGIAIYFHDVPKITGFAAQCWVNGEWILEKHILTPEGLKARNEYSARIIESNHPGPGTVVLGGILHFVPKRKEELEEIPMLHRLLGSRTVYDCTTSDIIEITDIIEERPTKPSCCIVS